MWATFDDNVVSLQGANGEWVSGFQRPGLLKRKTYQRERKWSNYLFFGKIY